MQQHKGITINNIKIKQASFANDARLAWSFVKTHLTH